jgi:hypothetical protein
MASPDVLHPSKSAAIEADTVSERDIASITAKDFLTILDREGLGAGSLNLLPEKKKVELHLEPEWTKALKVKDLVKALKNEKKKVELELPLGVGAYINPPYATPHVRAPQLGALPHAMAANGGSTSYPSDDQPDKWFPPQVEIRKASLDQRFEALAQNIAVLTAAMNELRFKLDRVVR